MATQQPAGAPTPQVLQWLHRVIAPEYQDPQRTYSDVATTLGALPTLSPRTSVYTHENGKPELLVHLFGTLPVIFRGATYNIPISIWVPHQYPKQPPIAFVTPAKDMMIRPGNHVDLAGKCYHPYLANWIHYSDRSNIVDLCDVLRGVFGREPPVMVKQSAAPLQQEPAAPPPRPPLPPELTPRAPGTPSLAATPPMPQGPPPLPPLPKEFTGDRNGVPVVDPRRHSMAPPLPPHPQQQQLHQQQQQQQPQHQQQPHPLPRPSGSGDVVGHVQPPPYGPSPVVPMHHRGGAPVPGSPQVQTHPTMASPLQPQTFYHHWNPPQHYPPQQQQQQQQQYFQPPLPLSYQGPPTSVAPQSPPAAPPPQSKAPTDLLDSPSPTPHSLGPTPAPLPPPNPEKDLLITRIAQKLHTLASTTHEQTTAALSSTSAQRSALHSANAALEREQHELRHISAVCDSDSEILRERIAMAEGVIQECRTRELPDVDAMVVAPSVVETQLYDLVAEDQAIEDTLYVLGKALDREKIPLEVFLKHARTLAREQFLKRALVKKITEEMGIE